MLARSALAARRSLSQLALAGVVLIWGSRAAAQVPLDRLEGFGARPARGFASPGLIAAAPAILGAGAPARAIELAVGARYSVVRAPESELAALLASTPGLRWSPPRHLLMDRARATLRLDAARAAGIGSGQGVVIGIVDSGVDAAHPDLRHADGRTRLAWWLDFGSNPAGLHPELEAALGCQPEAGLRCQILDAADLDARLGNDVAGDEPRDALGHGTFVAAIAAGNGAWGGGSAFAGVAPEATLVAVRVTGEQGTIADADVVLATQFVFERARELGMPAVVNLSLGSDFGAHDGSSELAEALAGLVGPEWPGRAIVVAGGNSGQLHGAPSADAEVLGIHTEAVATPQAPAQATLITPYPLHGLDTTEASLFVWIDLYPPEALSVGLVLPDGTRVEPVGIDQSRITPAGDLVAAVVHGIGDEVGRQAVSRDLPDLPLAAVLPSRGAAVVLVDGRWPAGGGFQIEIAGDGRAEFWVQSEGDLAPEGGTLGALFIGATAESTVTIPAAHPELIAVGASVDRLAWMDHTGTSVSVEALPVTPRPTLGAAAFFSSAGPSSSGDVKPDLLAPGAFVISALARSADPRTGAASIFSGGFCAGLGCQIVSDGYALSAGTSMAAPMVSGAAALLLEREPGLTQAQLRGLLLAGAAALAVPPEVAGRAGAGHLDVAASVMAGAAAPRGLDERPSPEHSRLRLADARAVASRPLAALLWLRDANGDVFDAASERVAVHPSGGELRAGVTRIAPGLYEFTLAAASPAPPALSIEVVVDGERLLAVELPVDGGREARGRSHDSGCGVARRPDLARGSGALLALALAATAARRRRKA